MATWWTRLLSTFKKPDPPAVRLANAILLGALRERASVVYIDRERGVRHKVGVDTQLAFELPGRTFELAVDRLKEFAEADQRAGTIRISIESVGMAVFEVRPFGRDGLVLTVEENPFPPLREPESSCG